MVIRRGTTAILLLGAGGVLSGCALPFAGPLVFTDILTGVSILSTAATGKGATEIALDVITGQDCRLFEGALREDRDFCEESGSAATEEDFKGVVAWLDDDDAPASPVPGGTDIPHIMVADIGLPNAAPTQPDAQWADGITVAVSNIPQPVALASLSEFPEDWIVRAALQTGYETSDLGALAPASGMSGLIHAKLDNSPLPFLQASASRETDLADWALEKMSTKRREPAEQALTLPPAPTHGTNGMTQPDDIHWNYLRNNLWPAVDIKNPPLQQDAVRRAVHSNELVQSTAAPLPAPAKPAVQALLPPSPAKPSRRRFHLPEI